MNSSFQIGLSGMSAAQTRLASAAHNVANLPTEPFRRQVVQPQTAAEGGVRVTLSSAAAPGEALAEDLVAQRQAAHEFTANLRTVQTADRMLGSLFDAFA